MTRLRRRYRAALLGVLAVFLLGEARADNAALEPFFGSFSGRGIAADSETPPGTPLKVRDLDVIIRRAGDGFVLTWGTAIAHRAPGPTPHVHYRVTTYAFVPGPRPNWFQATEVGDPLHGRPLVWARLENDTLYVSVYAVFEDGHNDLQIYERRVRGDRMDVTYSRTHNNEKTAVVRGWLVRQGD